MIGFLNGKLSFNFVSRLSLTNKIRKSSAREVSKKKWIHLFSWMETDRPKRKCFFFFTHFHLLLPSPPSLRNLWTRFRSWNYFFKCFSPACFALSCLASFRLILMDYTRDYRTNVGHQFIVTQMPKMYGQVEIWVNSWQFSSMMGRLINFTPCVIFICCKTEFW